MDNKERFFRRLEKTGLYEAFCRMEDIAVEMLGLSIEDAIEAAVAEMQKPQCRVRYEENGGKESYIFETRRDEDDEFGLDTAFQLKDDMVSYQALTKVRELMKLGYDIRFK